MKIVNLNGLTTAERLVVIEQTLNDIISNLYKDMIWSSYDDYTTNTKNYSMEQLAQFTDVSEVETGQMVYFAKQGVVALVGAINTQNKTFNVTDNYSIVGPVGPVGPAGPKGDTGATKVCHNIMFSKSVSQSEMIQCSFSIVDESPANYENLNFVYSALGDSRINAPQNHRFAATGIYMKNYISMPITSIRWSAATLRISYIDTTLEQPTQADYICTLSDSCTDCIS